GGGKAQRARGRGRPPLCPLPRLSYRTTTNPAFASLPAICANVGRPAIASSRSCGPEAPTSTTAGDFAVPLLAVVTVAPRLNPLFGMKTVESPAFLVNSSRVITDDRSSRKTTRD